MEKPEASAAVEENEIQQVLLLNLPTQKNWDGGSLYQYQGCWIRSQFLSATISFQRRFQARDSDIIITSIPKSGTTWLKALAFTIVNRSRYPLESSPLLTTPPHQLVPFFEVDLYLRNHSPNLEEFPKPRILATHVPYALLPNSILNSDCRILYVARNPLDQFISHWKLLSRDSGPKFQDQNMELASLGEAFEMFCNGVQSYGPIWEHTLGYWKASQEQPHKILFLKYEEMKEDIKFNVKKLANFLGCPFTEDEERQGMTEQISKFCSFDNMRNLEVNKNGKHPTGFKNDSFFRKGEVGDWENYLTPSMAERMEKILEEKFSGSGLSFKKES